MGDFGGLHLLGFVKDELDKFSFNFADVCGSAHLV